MDRLTLWLLGVICLLVVLIAAELLYLVLPHQAPLTNQRTISLPPSPISTKTPTPGVTTSDPTQPDRYFLPNGKKVSVGYAEAIGSPSGLLLFIGQIEEVSQTSDGILATVLTRSANGNTLSQMFLFPETQELAISLQLQKTNSFFPNPADITTIKPAHSERLLQALHVIGTVPVVLAMPLLIPRVEKLSTSQQHQLAVLENYLPCNTSFWQRWQQKTGEMSCMPLLTGVHVYVRPGTSGFPSGAQQ